MEGSTNIPNNAEIDAALKEYEKQKALEKGEVNIKTVSAIEPAHDPETGVKFEEDIYRGQIFTQGKGLSKMVEVLIKHSGGTIKTEKEANIFFLIFFIVAMSISFFLFFETGKPSPNPHQQKTYLPGSATIR